MSAYKTKRYHAAFLLLGLIAASFLVACAASSLQMRKEIANRLAAPSWMVERQVPAGLFALTAYERMHTRFAPANVYIEGDGLAWLSKSRKSMNPTPKNPVALHLATRDKAENLVYLARPCQYSGTADGRICDDAYWGQKRFARSVIVSYMNALDEIKKRYNLTGFHLIGYSGGGTVAALLAAERPDILSLRTVAGNLDHRAHSAHHGVSMLAESLNPVDYATHLTDIPQIHFTGGQDRIVPDSVLQSYLDALPARHCIRHEDIQAATHEDGWVNKWPDLLKMTPRCEPRMRAAGDFVPVSDELMDNAPIVRAGRAVPSKP